MAYQQVRALLTDVEDFHRGVADYYARLAKGCGAERTVLLLAYLEEHERKLLEAAHAGNVGSPHRLAGTWVTTSGASARLASVIQGLPKPSPGLTCDDVIALAVRLEDEVISVYRDVIDRDAPVWVIEAFTRLLELEQSEEKHMVAQASRGADL